MLVRVLLAAIMAGVLAGIFATAIQSFRVVPLILEAETYENSSGPDGAGGHSHGSGEANSGQVAMPSGGMPEADAWAPEDGWQRSFSTLVSNVLAGTAFGLILAAAMVLAGQGLSLRGGLIWGLCGFASFVLAPNLGLPPELPGMVAGDLAARQIWWVATVAMTAGALAIFFFARAIPFMLAGIALIVAPHLYGAPQPPQAESAVPAALAAEFAMATIVASGLFWLFLGGLLGMLLARAARSEETGNGR